MTRLNLLLLGILMVCALGVVTSQHHARKLYAELQHAQESAKQMHTEYSQLQLEQSTWAMHSRIEKIAQVLCSNCNWLYSECICLADSCACCNSAYNLRA